MKRILNLRKNTHRGMLQFGNDGAQRSLFVDLLDHATLSSNLRVHLDVVLFFALCHADLARISKYHFFVAAKQCFCFNDVGDNRRHGRQTVYQAAYGIDTDMCFHAEAPLVALFLLGAYRRRVVLSILCRGRRIDDRGANADPRAHLQALLDRRGINGNENAPNQIIGLQQAPEFQQLRRIGHRLGCQIHVDIRPHGLATANRIIDRLIRRGVPLPDKLHAPIATDWSVGDRPCRSESRER